jgi:hypothetical protein
MGDFFMKTNKINKILSIFALSAVITTSVVVPAFAESLTEVSPCHTFTGYLYEKSGYAEASTSIEHATSYKDAKAYVYVESLDSNGYKVNGNQDYGKPKAYTTVSSSRATGGYRSRHTVKDPQCANRYLRLEV